MRGLARQGAQGAGTQEPGARSQEPGVWSQESGARNQEPGVRRPGKEPRGQGHRMGATNSKEQGILGQMKNIVTPKKKPTPRTPPPLSKPPSSYPAQEILKRTVSSPQSLEERVTDRFWSKAFLDHLAALDAADALPAGQCHREACLQFVLEVEEVEDCEALPAGWTRYFHEFSGLPLDDPNVLRDCREAVERGEGKGQSRRAIDKAKDICLKKLLPFHEELRAAADAKESPRSRKTSSCCMF